jgi:hypothetical protein
MSTDDSIREAFVEAYPTYVASRLHERGVEVDAFVADAIVEGVSLLDRLLARLEAMPPEDQRQSPLELFREALRPVGQALATAGVPPPPVAARLAQLPWDVYDLAPGSSQVLGDRARDAHLRWGVTKALHLGAFSESRTTRRPAVLVLCPQADVPLIGASLDELGYRWAESIDDQPVVALVDMGMPDAGAAVRDAVGSGMRVVAYGDIDDIQAVGLRAAGAWKVVRRTTVTFDLGSVLPTLV